MPSFPIILQWLFRHRQFLLGLVTGLILALIALAAMGSSGQPKPNPDYFQDLKDEELKFSTEPDFYEVDAGRSNALAQRVRLLCWVMTSPENHRAKARHVKATWGRRCDVLLFMSSVPDARLPAVGLPVAEGRDNLWAKTKAAFRHVYRQHLQDADFFLKADDDTYVVVENLRYLLARYSPREPVYLGCRLRPRGGPEYMSGGAGYLLSREAVRRLVELGLDVEGRCREANDGDEDVEMGRCLERLGVRPGDSRDRLGRGRFYPLTPGEHMVRDKGPRHNDWYYKFAYYNSTDGLDCCADSAVAFHYVSPRDMYAMEYLIYRLRPYGVEYRFRDLT